MTDLGGRELHQRSTSLVPDPSQTVAKGRLEARDQEENLEGWHQAFSAANNLVKLSLASPNNIMHLGL